jgi:hypothetical protein
MCLCVYVIYLGQSMVLKRDKPIVDYVGCVVDTNENKMHSNSGSF